MRQDSLEDRPTTSVGMPNQLAPIMPSDDSLGNLQRICRRHTYPSPSPAPLTTDPVKSIDLNVLDVFAARPYAAYRQARPN